MTLTIKTINPIKSKDVLPVSKKETRRMAAIAKDWRLYDIAASKFFFEICKKTIVQKITSSKIFEINIFIIIV